MRMAAEGNRRLLRRRELLQQGVALGVGSLVLGPARSARAEAPAVRRYKRLGRTGLRISDISFGSSRSADPDLVRYALDRGVNYFDTAEGYKSGRSEEAIGEGLLGQRDRVFVASKVKAQADTKRQELMQSLEGSLKRLRTDYRDVYFNHAVNDRERLRNDEWFEFTESARKQGKIRFTGMSGHGGELVECLDEALDRDLFDVILVAYNFGQDPAFYQKLLNTFDFIAFQPDLPRVLAKAREKDVGVVAMKTLMGGRINDMRPYEREGGTFAQAAFRWVLSNPDVDAVVISMKSSELIDEYLGASGEGALREGDLRLLKHYASARKADYCRHGCDACATSCPHGVEISEVLRTRMYAVDYDDLALAREDYGKLGAAASACATCAHSACLGSCPFGLEIATLTREAHTRLGVV
jgi:predicted aldo/keto reductase-like oxidoreductase